MGKLGKFQKEPFTRWSGVTKKNHLNSVFAEKPQELTNLVTQLLAFHRGKTLDTFLSKLPVKYFDSDDEYTWPIVGSAVKNLPLVEARTIDGTPITDPTGSNVGANVEPFYVVFAENLFADGAVIVGELNEIYPLRILGDGRNEGTNTVYKVELMAGNTDGMPAEQLMPGKRFSKEYAPVERELSRKVDDITFASPTAMRNEFSQIRMQHKVSAAMINDKLAFGIPLEEEATGKIRVVDMWMHKEQWVLEQQWADAKNKLLAFGRSNRNKNGEYLNIGKSGEVIRMGAGLYEQMEYSNTMYYNTFSLKLIEDALYSIAAGKLDMKDRVFVLKTGERGAIQFHKAVLDTVSGWTAIFPTDGNAAIIRKTNSNLHQNALTAGFQFVEFQAPNGVIVKVDVDPYYDDPVRNKIQHYLGGPAFSYRYDIFDIGTTSEPNIFKVGVKGDEGDMTSYQWGLRNPFTGQKGNPYMSHDEDSATIHKMCITGVCVKDPTRTMSIIPAMLMG
jgi:hypothetical protein